MKPASNASPAKGATLVISRALDTSVAVGSWLYRNPVIPGLVAAYILININTIWPATRSLIFSYQWHLTAGFTLLACLLATCWTWGKLQRLRGSSTAGNSSPLTPEPGQVKARQEMQALVNERSSAARVATSQAASSSAVQPTPAKSKPSAREAQAAEEGRRKWAEQLQKQADEAAARQRAAAPAAPTPAPSRAPVVAPAASASTAAESRCVQPTNQAATSSTAATTTDGSAGGSKGGVASGQANGSNSGSTTAGGAGLARPPSTSRMIDRQTALEAEAQQQRWMEQLNTQLSAGGLQRHAQLQEERQLRQEQDQAFNDSLAADKARADARAAEEEARKAKTRRLIELTQLKATLKASLPEEPSEADSQEQANEGGGAPAVMQLRVKLPDGSNHSRRWLSTAPLSQVYDWVQSLDAFPSQWEPDAWQLACAYPRQLLARDATPLAEAAQGEKSWAVLVEKL